jgi:hypothetical protein
MPEGVLKVKDQAAEVEQIPAGLKLDEEIHVTVRPRVSSGHRAKDA